MRKPEPESLYETTPGKAPVRGYIHSADPVAGMVVLTHGAGGNCNSPLLVALADRLAAAGFATLRIDLPFRQRRPSGPPSPSDAKRDQEGLLRALELIKRQFSGPAFLGGASYGGRQASMLLAAEPSIAEGLLLLSYPLHPPGRPAQMRTAHFPNLLVPALFVSGTRDAFGAIDELQTAIKLIPAPTKLVPIEGAGHGLLQKSNRAELPDTIAREFTSFLSRGLAKSG